MTARNESAVSPVVGVMLMLVVTIIIAAVVSAYAGGTASSETKPPQALISAKFSVANGMTINHDGGDTLALKQIQFLISPGPTFGPNLEAVGSTILNKQNMTDSKGRVLAYADGTTNVTSLSSGESLFVSATNTTCNVFQTIAPSDFDPSTPTSYTGKKPTFWALCFRNSDNVGKTFTLKVVDTTSGKTISTSNVVISP